MIPFCPNCRALMAKADDSRNAFVCAPCRELIQFFDVGTTEDHTRRFGAGVVMDRYAVGVGA
jgi:DNA-directed RNA polymerase subunit M/transcription elongation factor TFIIS